jgi:hypothetical protein
MLFTVTTLPRRRRQAGMFTENFAEIADVIEAAFHCYFGQRQGVADEQLFRGPHPLAVQRFSERQPKNMTINASQIIGITVQLFRQVEAETGK